MDACIRNLDKLETKFERQRRRQRKYASRREQYSHEHPKHMIWVQKENNASESIEKLSKRKQDAFDIHVFPADKVVWHAAKYGVAHVIRTALDRSLPYECEDPKTMHTSFLMACQAGYLECATLLHQVGANIMATNIAGFTALHMACENGHLEIVQWLLQLIPDIDPFAKTFNNLSAIDVTRNCIASGDDRWGWHTKCLRALEQVRFLQIINMTIYIYIYDTFGGHNEAT
jgi:hypothetical protein